ELRLRRRRGERIEPTRQTFAEYAEEWLARQVVRPRTLEIYRWALNCHLLPYFGRRRLDQIHAEDIEAFDASMRRKQYRSGKYYKEKKIRKMMQPLGILHRQSPLKDLIQLNPLTHVAHSQH